MSLALPVTGTVHVSLAALDDCSARPVCLSGDERARAGRFQFEQDARRWSVCRSTLRRLLGGYLGTAPESFQFEMGPWGKPGLRDCPLRFNVSHSGGMALLAFAWRQEVGVDIECERTDFSPDDLAPQVFSAEEQSRLRDVPPAERSHAFLRRWTGKEAYVKADGRGLSFPLTQLTLLETPGTDRFQVRDLNTDGTDSGVSVCRLHLPADCHAALAVIGPPVDIHYFDQNYASSDHASSDHASSDHASSDHASTDQHHHPRV